MAYGTVNADVIGTSVAGSNLGAGNASIMKNRLINGSMTIDQRNAGASQSYAAGSSTYSLDRWGVDYSQTSKFTSQQNAGSVTPPVGFANYLGFTSSSAYSITSTDYFFTEQRIEGFNTSDLGFGTANAKTVTLSFQVYSSLTGTFGGALRNSAGNRAYPFSYSIPVANTWTTISVTIAGDTTGTWLTTNGIGIRVALGLGVGTTYSSTAGAWAAGNYLSATGAVSVVGTSGATFYITGVQLEVGSSATGYEYRQIQQELSLCQRYYEKSYNLDVAPATASQGISLFSSSGNAGGVTTAYIDTWLQYKVSKRAVPTMACWDEANGSGTCTRTNSGVLATSGQTVSFASVGFNSVVINSSSGANAGRISFNWTASAEL